MGEGSTSARTRRHLYSRVVAHKVAESDHFENEEVFVFPVVRERMNEREQLEVARHLLMDDDAEDPRWIIDWLIEELTPREQHLVRELEARFA